MEKEKEEGERRQQLKYTPTGLYGRKKP